MDPQSHIKPNGKTHKNADIYQVFSQRMTERGYERMGEEGHIKIKTLQQVIYRPYTKR